jgi:hypothetical protein
MINLFFRTIAALDVIQSTGVPLVLLGGEKSLNPLELNSYDCNQESDCKACRFSLRFIYKTANSKRIQPCKRRSIQMGKKKEIQRSFAVFSRSGYS